jgi:hypothetical protein
VYYESRHKVSLLLRLLRQGRSMSMHGQVLSLLEPLATPVPVLFFCWAYWILGMGAAAGQQFRSFFVQLPPSDRIFLGLAYQTGSSIQSTQDRQSVMHHTGEGTLMPRQQQVVTARPERGRIVLQTGARQVGTACTRSEPADVHAQWASSAFGFATSHPRYFTERLVRSCLTSFKALRFFHIPFQRATATSARMLRGYTHKPLPRIIHQHPPVRCLHNVTGSPDRSDTGSARSLPTTTLPVVGYAQALPRDHHNITPFFAVSTSCVRCAGADPPVLRPALN